MERVGRVIATLCASLLSVTSALAQDAPGAAAPGGGASGANPAAASGAAPGAGAVAAPSPASPDSMPGSAPGGPGSASGAGAAGASVYAPPAGASPANANAHLPSSSKPSSDTSRASDYFDLAPSTGGGAVVHGDPNAAFSPQGKVEGLRPVPDVHVVQRGDTLWELCDRYFRDPWAWPRIWSYNPALQNPHWIYPGDQLNMVAVGARGAQPAETSRFVGRGPGVPPNTVFLRDQGYIDDADRDTWGEIGGSPEDQLLLSDGDDAYLDIASGHEVKPGQELTVFRLLRGAFRADPKGTLVKILGTARVEKWDARTHVARARLVESLDVIERGAKVGPVGRKFDVVAPVQNGTEVWARVAASLYPHVLFGQNQVVFIDRGRADGLIAGNRLFALAHGDEYRKTLVGASEFAASSVAYESEKPAIIEPGGALGHGDDANYADEVVGELRVLSVRDHSAACLVTGSLREIEPGQRVVARRGY
jgi:hypothetical protein